MRMYVFTFRFLFSLLIIGALLVLLLGGGSNQKPDKTATQQAAPAAQPTVPPVIMYVVTNPGPLPSLPETRGLDIKAGDFVALRVVVDPTNNADVLVQVNAGSKAYSWFIPNLSATEKRDSETEKRVQAAYTDFCAAWQQENPGAQCRFRDVTIRVKNFVIFGSSVPLPVATPTTR